MALYGIVLLMVAVVYYILQTMIIRNHQPDSVLSRAIGKDLKGKISLVIFFIPIISYWLNSRITGKLDFRNIILYIAEH
jgi:uncharacterized membrane protein